MKLSQALSERVRTLREAAGLSQQEIAIKADLSLSQISKLEQGKKADPRASTLIALALALGIKPGQLIDDLPVTEATLNSEDDEAKKKKKDRKEKKHKKGNKALTSDEDERTG